MNERIRLLAEQAEEWVCKNYPDAMDDSDEFHSQTMAKFAELIVWECQRQVEEQYKPVLEDKEMMKNEHWDGYVQGGVDCYVAISEHFYGVEE